MQAHARQHFLDLVQRLAAEVRRAQHLGFGLLDQIADIDDVVVLQAVGRAHRKFQFVDFLEQQRVEFQPVVHVVAQRRFRLVEVHENRQLVLKDACGIGHGVIRRQRAISFDLHRQLVIIQNLALAGGLHFVADLLDRRIDGVDRHKADGRVFRAVLVGRDIAFAGIHGQFHEHIRTIVEVQQDVILVQNLDPVGFRDIPGGDHARTLGRNRQALRTFDFHLQADALEVQHDVGHVFAHTGHRGKLVQHVVDLYRGDRSTLKRRHQNAAQRVAQRQAKAPLQRFCNNGRLTRRIGAGANIQLRRLDKFLPVLMDHACRLHTSLLPMSLSRKTPEDQK